MERLSVKEFSKQLIEQVENICRQYNLNYSKEADRGYAFQLWIAEMISSYEQFFDNEPDDAVLWSNDLKADIVFDDNINKQILICQCKFSSLGRRKPVDEDEVLSFFDRHSQFMNREWIESHGSKDAIHCLADYSEKVIDGYSVVFRFISTGDASSRIKELTENKTIEYQKRSLDVKCELIDFTDLKDYYLRAQSLEESIPDSVTIHIREKDRIIIEKPYKTVIGIISGNQLKDIYGKHKESLFSYNIRNYLGNRGINSYIKETATSDPENFIYFNNGISAICTDFSIENNTIIAEKFQVINGAQTVGTLSKCPPSDKIKVLLKLTAGGIKKDKGFNQKIIQYNNTQNAIKISDFKSNDSIQLWLERKFEEQKSTDVIGKLRYVRKRTFKRVHGKISIKLEEFAKIRYSYFYEPTKCLSLPRALWTSKDEGGEYEKAFGIDGELEAQWSDEDFKESLIAIAFYYKILDNAKRLAGRSNELKYMNKLKWHSLSLAGIFIRERRDDFSVSQLLNNKDNFNKLWEEYWNIDNTILDEVYSRAMEDNVTIFAFIRNKERYNNMKQRMQKRILMV